MYKQPTLTKLIVLVKNYDQILDTNVLLSQEHFQKVANRQLQFSNNNNICLKRLLNQEISNKCKLVKITKQKLTSMKDALHHERCFIDFVHVTTIFQFLMIKQFLKSKKLMVRSFTICFIINIMTLLLRHTMLIRSFLIFEVIF